MSDVNYKKTSKIIFALVILLIAGAVLGFSVARTAGKNQFIVPVQKQVRLAEDLYIENPEVYRDVVVQGMEEEPLLIPAGTEGKVKVLFSYYSVYKSNGGYNEFARKQYDRVTVEFPIDNGYVKVRFAFQPSESSGSFDSYILEDYDSTLAELNNALNEFHSQWIFRELVGGIIGLVFSLILAGVFFLIRKKSVEVTVDSTLLGVITAVDIILIIVDIISLYTFTLYF